jgi:NAD(P)-dependent dehydrogenase (short-subunit alcohol dehydrogenase family)
VKADLSSFREVRELAERVTSLVSDGDPPALLGLVNNAAAVSSRYTTTRDGLELQIAVNHFAPFLLTRLLLPTLQAHGDARVVNVTSGSHRHGRIRWNDICLRRGYNLLRAYAQAKLANLMTTLELAERCAGGGGPQVYAFDPGLVNTGIGEKDTRGIPNLVWRLRRRGGAPPDVPAAALANLLAKPASELPAAVYRTVNGPGSPSRRAADSTARSRMWELSERICGVSTERTAH